MGRAATPVTTVGFPLETRKIALDNTMLIGLNEDGTPNGLTATLRYSGIALFQPGVSIAYPPLANCDPAYDTISAVTFNGEFNFCVPPNDA